MYEPLKSGCIRNKRVPVRLIKHNIHNIRIFISLSLSVSVYAHTHTKRMQRIINIMQIIKLYFKKIFCTSERETLSGVLHVKHHSIILMDIEGLFRILKALIYMYIFKKGVEEITGVILLCYTNIINIW